MKKLLAVAAAVLAVGGILATGVSANPDAGTVLESGFPCAVLDGNGNSFITENSSLTLYQSKVVLKCSGDGAPYLGPNPPIYWNAENTGLSCNMLDFGATRNWQDKVGRNGNSQLVCTQAIIGQPSGSAAGGVGA